MRETDSEIGNKIAKIGCFVAIVFNFSNNSMTNKKILIFVKNV